jgi:hypothetical protein
MKRVLIIAGLLLLAGMGTGACSVVEVLNVQPSSQNIRITVLRDGITVRDVKLEVLMADEQLRLSVSTDKHGTAALPSLPPGRYHIVATSSGGLGADLVLDVSKNRGKKTSLFSMDLSVRPPPPPTLAQRIATAEGLATSKRMQSFHGILEDLSGAGIQGAKVEIFQKGSLGKAQVTKVASDATGHFSAPLADGAYTVIFQVPGFSTQIQVFEIALDGDMKESRIILQIAPCT